MPNGRAHREPISPSSDECELPRLLLELDAEPYSRRRSVGDQVGQRGETGSSLAHVSRHGCAHGEKEERLAMSKLPIFTDFYRFFTS